MTAPPSVKLRAPGIGVCCFTNSLTVLHQHVRDAAHARIHALGYELVIGEHTTTLWRDQVISPTAAVADLHAAFQNPKVDLVMTGLGGFTSNWGVQALDVNLLRAFGKPVCGYSDTTSLLLRVHQITGQVMYYGPHYGSLGVQVGEGLSTWSIERFREIVEGKRLIQDITSDTLPRGWIPNEDWVSGNPEAVRFDAQPRVLSGGSADGVLLAGHLNSILLSMVSGWCPRYDDCILAIETDLHCPIKQFIREFVTLLTSPIWSSVRGILIGRCQPASKVRSDMLKEFLNELPQLEHLPVVVDVPFGHTFPSCILPIGAQATFVAEREGSFALRFPNQRWKLERGAS